VSSAFRPGVLVPFALVLLAAPVVAQAEGDLAERRAWAVELREQVRGADLELVLAALGDPDPLTRRHLVGYLGAVELEEEAARARRVEALARLAREDESADVRGATLTALARRDSPAAARALIELAVELPPEERVLAAELYRDELLPRCAPAREELESRVLESFAEGERPLPPETLVRLLPAYGRRLAEREAGGELRRERAPIVLSFTHPDPRLRAAAEAALAALLDRLQELERDRRADRLLERFTADGLSTRSLVYLRALRRLETGGDAEAALAAARELGRTRAGDDELGAGSWRSRGALLEASALAALDRLEESRAALRRAGDTLDGLIARRFERSGETGVRAQRDLFLQRALVDFGEAFLRVAAGDAPHELGILHRLRRAHGLLLEAQLVAQGGDVPFDATLAPLYDSRLSPVRLVFAQRPHPSWPASRCLRTRWKLDRAFASVCGREMLGFEPFPDVLADMADPVLDPLREPRLSALERGELRALDRRHIQLSTRMLQGLEPDPGLEIELERLQVRRRMLDRAIREDSPAERYHRLRYPSDEPLALTESLRREGRAGEARDLAQAFLEALEDDDLKRLLRWEPFAARAEELIGGCWSDEGDAARAEEHLLAALELREGLRSYFEEVGAAALVADADDMIAGNLVSLAVNANVKGGDPEKALGYFERAYALRQDEFMRVMLACYRARSGRAEEARELLTDVLETPSTFYNLACTHALLGDTEEAFALLEAAIERGNSTPGERAKQKEWARGDPDLEALRADPRFELLTAPEPELDPRAADDDSSH